MERLMPPNILQQIPWNHLNKEENCYGIGKTVCIKQLLQPMYISVNTMWRSTIKTDVVLSFGIISQKHKMKIFPE